MHKRFINADTESENFIKYKKHIQESVETYIDYWEESQSVISRNVNNKEDRKKSIRKLKLS
ncbi:MAG: hypothetical protein K2I03_13850 [Lachnospiraceae bacterium]|nr:hypothetical protein [Lachnospiraceae bacterium]